MTPVTFYTGRAAGMARAAATWLGVFRRPAAYPAFFPQTKRAIWRKHVNCLRAAKARNPGGSQ